MPQGESEEGSTAHAPGEARLDISSSPTHHAANSASSATERGAEGGGTVPYIRDGGWGRRMLVLLRLKPTLGRVSTGKAYLSYSVTRKPRGGDSVGSMGAPAEGNVIAGLMALFDRRFFRDSNESSVSRSVLGFNLPAQQCGPTACDSTSSTGAHYYQLSVLSPLSCLDSGESMISSNNKGAPPTSWSNSASQGLPPFSFDRVFDRTETDEQVCTEVVSLLLHRARTGRHSTLLLHGPSGGGKTHALHILAPALIQSLLTSLVDVGNDVLEVSYVQIVDNRAYNLLGSAFGRLGSPLPPPSVSESSHELPCQPRVVIRDIDEVQRLLKKAEGLKWTTSHELNARSSCSHCILSLTITQCWKGAPVVSTVISLVDLGLMESSQRLSNPSLSLAQHHGTAPGGGSSSVAQLHNMMLHGNGSSAVLPAPPSLSGEQRLSLLQNYLRSFFANGEPATSTPYSGDHQQWSTLSHYLQPLIKDPDTDTIIVACGYLETAYYSEALSLLRFGHEMWETFAHTHSDKPAGGGGHDMIITTSSSPPLPGITAEDSVLTPPTITTTTASSPLFCPHRSLLPRLRSGGLTTSSGMEAEWESTLGVLQRDYEATRQAATIERALLARMPFVTPHASIPFSPVGNLNQCGGLPPLRDSSGAIVTTSEEEGEAEDNGRKAQSEWVQASSNLLRASQEELTLLEQRSSLLLLAQQFVQGELQRLRTCCVVSSTLGGSSSGTFTKSPKLPSVKSSPGLSLSNSAPIFASGGGVPPSFQPQPSSTSLATRAPQPSLPIYPLEERGRIYEILSECQALLLTRPSGEAVSLLDAPTAAPSVVGPGNSSSALVAGPATTSLLQRHLDSISMYLVNCETLLDAAVEQEEVLRLRLAAVRREEQSHSETLQESKTALTLAYSEIATLLTTQAALQEEKHQLHSQLDAMELEFYRECAAQAVRQETLLLFHRKESLHVQERKALRRELRRREETIESLQHRLTAMEGKVGEALRMKGSVDNELRRREEAFKAVWLLLSPQQKARFNDYGSIDESSSTSAGAGRLLGSGAAGSGSLTLPQSHEVARLRSQMVEIQRELDCARETGREHRGAMEELQREVKRLCESMEKKEIYSGRLKKERDGLKTYVEKLEEQLVEAVVHSHQQVERLKAFKEEIQVLQEERQKAKDECEDTRGECERLEQMVASLRREMEEQSSKMSMLTQHIQRIHAERTQQNYQRQLYYEGRIRELEKQLLLLEKKNARNAFKRTTSGNTRTTAGEVIRGATSATVVGAATTRLGTRRGLRSDVLNMKAYSRGGAALSRFVGGGGKQQKAIKQGSVTNTNTTGRESKPRAKAEGGGGRHSAGTVDSNTTDRSSSELGGWRERAGEDIRKSSKNPPNSVRISRSGPVPLWLNEN